LHNDELHLLLTAIACFDGACDRFVLFIDVVEGGGGEESSNYI
jgi:hypothetical protein